MSFEKLQLERLDLVCMRRKLKEKNIPGDVTISFDNMSIVVRKKVAIKVLSNSINSIDGRIGLQYGKAVKNA